VPFPTDKGIYQPGTFVEQIEAYKLKANQKLGELSKGSLPVTDTQNILAKISIACIACIACIDKNSWDLNYENDVFLQAAEVEEDD
jgi:hypothetical protein